MFCSNEVFHTVHLEKACKHLDKSNLSSNPDSHRSQREHLYMMHIYLLNIKASLYSLGLLLPLSTFFLAPSHPILSTKRKSNQVFPSDPDKVDQQSADVGTPGMGHSFASTESLVSSITDK